MAKRKIKVHKSIDKANMKQYEINGIKRSDEYIYFCSVCKKITCLDRSYSSKGHRLICDRCAMIHFPKVDDDTHYRHIDYQALLSWCTEDASQNQSEFANTKQTEIKRSAKGD